MTVAGDITVQSGETLIIQPGVLVLFTGRYKFTVSGLPDAKGTESDTIIFTRAEPTELSNWRGFRFDGACDAGGGICSRYDTSEINNNTILGNQMNRGGGVYVLTYSYLPPVICNTILWDNSASTDPEIHLDPTPGSNAVVTFGDISGGWSVQGNIDEDPLFTSPGSDDYSLPGVSPCIDRGDPAYDVPRGGACIIDIGSFEFWQGTNCNRLPVQMR